LRGAVRKQARRNDHQGKEYGDDIGRQRSPRLRHSRRNRGHASAHRFKPYYATSNGKRLDPGHEADQSTLAKTGYAA
jgi:hypothetical protein